MSLNKGKHITQEIDGAYCTVVESGISKSRMEFLKGLLEFNHFVVKSMNGEIGVDETPLYVLGVTDLVFNPVISVFEQSLNRPEGGKVSPTYWNQEKEIESLPYFDYREKNGNAENEDDFLPNPWAYRTL